MGYLAARFRCVVPLWCPHPTNVLSNIGQMLAQPPGRTLRVHPGCWKLGVTVESTTRRQQCPSLYGGGTRRSRLRGGRPSSRLRRLLLRMRLAVERDVRSMQARDASSGGPGIRTPMGLRPAVFKTAALPVRSSPPGPLTYRNASLAQREQPCASRDDREGSEIPQTSPRGLARDRSRRPQSPGIRAPGAPRGRRIG
jgi:hypothetical protein